MSYVIFLWKIFNPLFCLVLGCCNKKDGTSSAPSSELTL